jgi:hypothetical protein
MSTILNLVNLPEEVINEPNNLETAGQARPDFTRLLYMLYVTQVQQVQIADNKAGLILAANALLLAGVTIERGLLHKALLAEGMVFGERLSALLLVLTMTSLAISVVFALLASRPKLVRPGSPETMNMFFFQHIGAMQPEAYCERFLGQTFLDIKLAVLQQINALSKVVNRKFLHTRYSLDFLVMALLFWGGARLMLALVA